jgi:hypothetical protein
VRYCCALCRYDQVYFEIRLAVWRASYDFLPNELFNPSTADALAYR